VHFVWETSALLLPCIITCQDVDLIAGIFYSIQISCNFGACVNSRCICSECEGCYELDESGGFTLLRVTYVCAFVAASGT